MPRAHTSQSGVEHVEIGWSPHNITHNCTRCSFSAVYDVLPFFAQDDDDFLASGPSGDQQVLAQEQSKSSVVAPPPAVAPLEDDAEVTFDANKVSLQVPDRLFGPSFTAVTGISQAIGTVVQVRSINLNSA